MAESTPSDSLGGTQSWERRHWSSASRASSARGLLAVSAATVSHRDLPALFHKLAILLHQVVRVDSLALFLHDDAGRTCRGALHRRGAEFIAADCLTKAVVAEITQRPVPDGDDRPPK
jgi:hypothetical protein